ncbi:Yop proteins translocation protein L [Variovorax sp. PBS-H4]|uniref:HrpE/YscL family type III secretion apparatus protein n=1 Tax=Variovorax sp. PBS-H4 TaxID=434008 RepID=UPI001315C425|nr:HrpE/YscL family type III secretion apparatus protein [Variovorax sp. PBS-H4]VTU27084.1 Yop proteins translocation protein L [Variovorax sp. PBS-H4]
MFIAREKSSLSRLDTAAKVVKAKDFWAYKEAREAVEEALRRKEEILLSAQEAYRAERERGYREGSESARLEQSGNIVEIVSQTAQYYGRVETEMVDLVLDAVRKVVSDFSDRDRVSTVVRNCMDLVRTQKSLSLNVHPSQVEHVRGELDALRRQFPSVAQIDVHPDAKVALDACIVESDIGIVEASLHGQMEKLRETLVGVFAPKPELAADLDREPDGIVDAADSDDLSETDKTDELASDEEDAV